MLRSQVQHSEIKRGLKISLDCKLKAAQRLLSRGHLRAAANLLGAFANQVRALQRVRLLPGSLADLWKFEVKNILADI